MSDMTETELLARMWIESDPNRKPESADEIITMYGPERQVPKWHWFIPRAEESLHFFAHHGYRLVKIDG